jgi:hypothetical protein
MKRFIEERFSYIDDFGAKTKLLQRLKKVIFVALSSKMSFRIIQQNR